MRIDNLPKWEMACIFMLFIILLLVLVWVLRIWIRKIHNRHNHCHDNDHSNIPETHSKFKSVRSSEGTSVVAKLQKPVNSVQNPIRPSSVKPIVNKLEESPQKNSVLKEYFLPLNSGDIFFSREDHCVFQSKFKAVEINPNEMEFTLISVDKIRSCNISDAVTNVGTVLQHVAANFEMKSMGMVELKTDPSGVSYWEIARKAKVEYKKQ